MIGIVSFWVSVWLYIIGLVRKVWVLCCVVRLVDCGRLKWCSIVMILFICFLQGLDGGLWLLGYCSVVMIFGLSDYSMVNVCCVLKRVFSCVICREQQLDLVFIMLNSECCFICCYCISVVVCSCWLLCRMLMMWCEWFSVVLVEVKRLFIWQSLVFSVLCICSLVVLVCLLVVCLVVCWLGCRMGMVRLMLVFYLVVWELLLLVVVVVVLLVFRFICGLFWVMMFLVQ